MYQVWDISILSSFFQYILSCFFQNIPSVQQPVAPVVQLVTSKPSDVET